MAGVDGEGEGGPGGEDGVGDGGEEDVGDGGEDGERMVGWRARDGGRGGYGERVGWSDEVGDE